MAQFPGLSLTVQGNKMILKSSTGKTEDRLIITKAVIGDGQLTASIDGLTEIVSKKLEIGLSQVKEVANGQMQLQFNFDNRQVEIGFFWREVGLYAKNGDSGEEKLIGYSNAKGLTSYIPDKTNVIPMQRLVIALGVGDNPNVKGEVDFSSTITLEQLETAIDTHNKAAEAHKEQFKTINEKITAIEDSKVAKTSADYIKSLVTNTNGLEATKGNGTKELLKLLTNVDSGDNQGLAPTLELVKELQEGYLPITGGDLKGEITVNGKAAKTIVDSWYSDDKSQYWVKYSDGELVQMITKDNPGATGITNVMINLFQPFIDINYFVNAVYETHSKRRPNNNTSLSNSIAATDNTVTESNFTPKSKNQFTIAIDSMSLCRVYCVGRWK